MKELYINGIVSVWNEKGFRKNKQVSARRVGT